MSFLSIFNGNQEKIKESEELQKLIEKSQSTLEFADKPVYLGEVSKRSAKGQIIVIKTDSVDAIFGCKGKTAALNFASAKNPGGGVVRGAVAQEEALCIDSGLYNVLNCGKAMREYYEPNRRLKSLVYNDTAIYSENVPFISSSGKEMPLKLADIVTCPAPNLNGFRIKPEDAGAAFERRWRIVLSLMIRHGVEEAVLGAWGCGVFRNDPKVVAGTLLKTINDMDALYYLDKIVLAVPGGKNYDAFKETFEPLN